MNAIAAQIKLLQHAGKILDANLMKEWTRQGHHLTGAAEQSVHGLVIAIGNSVILSGTAAGYVSIVDAGVRPDRIPYGGQSASGGTSKYITGLVNYWKLRGLGEKEAIRAAFATAKKQKEEGMSTKASAKYSQTGQRQRFLEVVDKVIHEGIDELIRDGLDEIVDRKYHETKSTTI